MRWNIPSAGLVLFLFERSGRMGKVLIWFVIIISTVVLYCLMKVKAESDELYEELMRKHFYGWSMMKTISQVFVTGVKEITTTPALFGDVLEYEGKFYKVGTVRQEVKDTKVEDDSFYLLTLAAVARGVDEVKQEAAHKEAPKVRDDKAR